MILPEFQLIGIKLDAKTTNINGKSMEDCGNLWQQFERDQVFAQIPGKTSMEVYAVYYGYEGDHMAPFDYFIGCKAESNTTVPEGLASLTVPEQNYIKVVANGQMPACIGEAWQTIWKSEYDRAFGYDFEVYDERSQDWSNAEVDIFLSVK